MVPGMNEEGRISANGSVGFCCGATASPKRLSSSAKTDREGAGKRIRDYLVTTNLDILIIGIVLASYHAVTATASAEDEDGHSSTAGSNGDGSVSQHSSSHTESEAAVYAEEKREVYAVLFPWFTEIVGVTVYFFLSRYMPAIPYTASMFLVGVAIGFSIQGATINAITFSASTWLNIEGEVLLLVFLPGLLYLDSYNIDVRLFKSSFWQLWYFAFPMVLAGTSLTALVAYYILPYGWSFDLSMTFGSILAATDPVAVAVLLNELGAPPRLKMHISGESLLNDGSAVVFYHIFSLRYFYELGIAGVGEDVGWGEGFKLFFRLSLGGACIGLVFGVGLVIILFGLNRRLSGEDSVVQVVATIATAYLAFFTSEILSRCSGIIAVVFCGITVKALGESLYNDSHLSHSFWEILEYLLNTLIFTLGGCLWGGVILGKSHVDDLEEHWFGGNDWGYLILLFLMVTLIRFFLVFAFYPITSRIGIGSSWREAVFMSYGGLRGAVGIALALSLNAEVFHATSASEVSAATRAQFREDSSKLFGMVGGIALLTLVINGPTSGPLLKKLGLVTPTETRKKVVENYHEHVKHYTLVQYVGLLTEKRFHDVDWNVIKEHVPFLRDMSFNCLLTAVQKHKSTTHPAIYVEPKLKNVVPYFLQPGENEKKADINETVNRKKIGSRSRLMTRERTARGSLRETVFNLRSRYDDAIVQEERLVFIKILRFTYHHLIDLGEIPPRGFMIYSLKQSLDYAWDSASKGEPLSDWEYLEVASRGFSKQFESMMRRWSKLKHDLKRKRFRTIFDVDFFVVQMKVQRLLAFIQAHTLARKIFKEEFSKTGDGSLTAVEKVVLDESDKQVEHAKNALNELDESDVKLVSSHYACLILLNRAANYFKKLQKHGLMSPKEAGEFLEDIEEAIYDVHECHKVVHKGEVSQHHKEARLSEVTPSMLKGLNLRTLYEDSNADLSERVKEQADQLDDLPPDSNGTDP